MRTTERVGRWQFGSRRAASSPAGDPSRGGRHNPSGHSLKAGGGLGLVRWVFGGLQVSARVFIVSSETERPTLSVGLGLAWLNHGAASLGRSRVNQAREGRAADYLGTPPSSSRASAPAQPRHVDPILYPRGCWRLILVLGNTSTCILLGDLGASSASACRPNAASERHATSTTSSEVGERGRTGVMIGRVEPVRRQDDNRRISEGSGCDDSMVTAIDNREVGRVLVH
ncbi:hypothetical protein THAOC_03071 [Thalassiosira oceanica]|uniref:Uncharacterized protein n=1 Tax=Thalassiosira oceanica TaxID=159749 RepID=K0TQ07_THAOC|nr:hypothetical protein THAOC_03071 [Thalassiosira oceanica]|eukprot:EJK75217.1 hypothetical protein THAOC_03071 [Thalassiosira oceanica]